MKVLFVSLGCDKNRVDSEYMIKTLFDNGYELVDDETKAEIIIINTCCFILDAKEESINTIIELGQQKEEGALKYLILTGCLSERYSKEIFDELPEVDAVLGTNAGHQLIPLINKLKNGQTHIIGPSTKNDTLYGYNGRSLTTPGHYAHLKIADGCNKNCSYCIIPSIRGNYRSVPIEELVNEAKKLAELGVKELILVAQETTLYGIDLYKKKSLHILLDELNKIDGIKWIRIMYCYPEEIYDELIDSIERNEKVCHYLDMPIQHFNDSILKNMNRKTTVSKLSESITSIRTRIPDMVFRTSLIAGFPGETKKEHKDMLSFIEKYRFDHVGIFTFSPEEGTAAFEMNNQVDEAVKEKFKEEAMVLQQKVNNSINQSLIDKVYEVIIDGYLPEDNLYVGRTYRDAPDIDGLVFINSNRELMTGDFVQVKITEAYEYDLIGDIIDDEFTK